MRSIRSLLVGTLIVSSAALFAPDAAAGGSSQRPFQTIGHSLELIRLLISRSLMATENPFMKPLVLTSDARGSITLTTSSACKLVVDSACLATCKPASFTLSAYNECKAYCDAGASQQCKQDCNPGCKSDCLASDCDFDAALACETSCQAGCGIICAVKAAAEQIDSSDCEVACGTTCSSHCASAASVNDIANCGVQCGASCQAQCTATANMDCQIGCQTALFEDETDACAEICSESGSLFCDGAQVDARDINECMKALAGFGILVSGG